MDANVFLDLDGVVDTGVKGQIVPGIPKTLARWNDKVGTITFVTNRPARWVETHLVLPIAKEVCRTERSLFAICEQGCVIAEYRLNADSKTFKRGRQVVWNMPQRGAVIAIVDRACRDGLVPGNLREGPKYQVCVEKCSNLSGDILALIPASTRRHLKVVRTRSTITIIPKQAGKDVAVAWLLESYPSLKDGINIGFGDDADTFARVVPVIDVDRKRRRTFEKSGMRAAPCDRPDVFCEFGLPCLQQEVLNQEYLHRGCGWATQKILQSYMPIFA